MEQERQQELRKLFRFAGLHLDWEEQEGHYLVTPFGQYDYSCVDWDDRIPAFVRGGGSAHAIVGQFCREVEEAIAEES